MNKIDYESIRAHWEQEIQEAERYLREGVNHPESKLRPIREALSRQLQDYEVWEENHPPIPEHIRSRELCQELVGRIDALLEAGPHGPAAPLPELKDAFLTDAKQVWGEDSPRLEDAVRLPYSAMTLELVLVTVWGKGEGIWGVRIEAFDGDGHIRLRDDDSNLELPRTGDLLGFSVRLSFRKPETQTIVFYLAGQEVRRFSVTYEDSRVPTA